MGGREEWESRGKESGFPVGLRGGRKAMRGEDGLAGHLSFVLASWGCNGVTKDMWGRSRTPEIS